MDGAARVASVKMLGVLLAVPLIAAFFIVPWQRATGELQREMVRRHLVKPKPGRWEDSTGYGQWRWGWRFSSVWKTLYDDPDLGPLARRARLLSRIGVVGFVCSLWIAAALVVTLDPVLAEIVPVAAGLRIPVVLCVVWAVLIGASRLRRGDQDARRREKSRDRGRRR